MKDVHIGLNKDKILFVLYSSKTHGKESLPQKVKISANNRQSPNMGVYIPKANFCPFKVFCDFMVLRGGYDSDDEQLFIFKGKIPVQPLQIRNALKTCISRVGLNPDFYDFHSFRAGRSSDLAKLGYTVEQIKRLGRWKSNAVYRYIKL